MIIDKVKMLFIIALISINSIIGQNQGIITGIGKGNFKVGFTHLTLNDYLISFDKFF